MREARQDDNARRRSPRILSGSGHALTPGRHPGGPPAPGTSRGIRKNPGWCRQTQPGFLRLRHSKKPLCRFRRTARSPSPGRDVEHAARAARVEPVSSARGTGAVAHRAGGMGKPEARKRSRQRERPAAADRRIRGLARICRRMRRKGKSPPADGSTQKNLVPAPSARLEVASSKRQG